MARKRLGELLLERGAISLKQLEAALAEQRVSRERLGAVLVRQEALTEQELAEGLAEALGLTAVDLREKAPSPEALSKVRARFCEGNDLLPLSLEQVDGEEVLTVAMADPLNVSPIEELAFIAGVKVVVAVAPLSQVREAIVRAFRPEKAAPAEPEVLSADDAVLEEPEPEEVIEGEALDEREQLARLIEERAAAARTKRRRGLSEDLDYLFGNEAATEVESLERKFWALMRLMAKKGLITKEEFTRELDEE